MDESQRALVAASLANRSHGGNRKSKDQVANLQLDPPSQEEAAVSMGVSPRSVADAAAVLKEGSPTQEERKSR